MQGTNNGNTFDWQPCVAAVTDDHSQELSAWRGYSLELCKWLRNQSYVGLYRGGWAFPVQDKRGKVFGAHYLSGDPANKDWQYSPDATAEPLIIGDVEGAGETHCFESQWDAFAFLDRSGAYLNEAVAVIITRGASNTSKIAARIYSETELFIWPQNDRPRKNGEVPSENWFNKLQASLGRQFYRATTPPEYADLNDWTRNGATKADLLEALKTAKQFKAPDSEPIPNWLLPVNAAQITRTKAPEIIRGVLYQGAKITVQGGSKSYKTWIMLNLAYCIANGIPFLGFPTLRTRTYYANLELMDFDLASRLDQIQAAYGKGDQSNIDVVNLRGKTHDLNTLRLQQMAQIIEQGGYLFFALDPVYKLMAGKDENSSGEVTKLLQPFERICVDTNAAFAYAGHFSKGSQANKNPLDRVSGAGAWARDPDCVLTLTEHTEADCFTAEFTLRSFPTIQPFVVRWQFPLLRIDDEGLDPKQLKQPAKAGRPVEFQSDLLLTALRASDREGGLTYSEFLNATGLKKSTFKNKLADLRRRKVIFQSATDGRYQLSPQYASSLQNGQ